MGYVLLVLGVICLVGYFALHNSADKDDVKFQNRPTTITNLNSDLLTNQKYAIVGLLAYIQGSSSISAYSEEATKIVQSSIFSLGLSRSEVERYIKVSSSRDPENEIHKIVDSLKEIKDKQYIRELYNTSLKIAHISKDINTIDVTNEIFNELI